MSILKKQDNAVIHGLTPFYYIHMSQNTQNSFNIILSKTNVDLCRNFIEAVLEIIDFIELRYRDRKTTDLTAEELSIAMDKTVVYSLAELYRNSLNYSSKELRNIYEDMLLNFSIDHDVMIGQLSLNELLKLNKDDLDEKLKAELNRFRFEDSSKETDVSIVERTEAINALEELQKNLNYAHRLVEKRIQRIESRSVGKSGDLTTLFEDVRNTVEILDSRFLGEVDGFKNEELSAKNKNLRDMLGKLGIDTSINKYVQVASAKSYVSSLSNKTFNQRNVPILEGKKKSFEVMRIEVSSLLRSLKDEKEVDMFYF